MYAITVRNSPVVFVNYHFLYCIFEGWRSRKWLLWIALDLSPSQLFSIEIGIKSIEFAFNVARGINKRVITIWVLSNNLNAIGFYEKCGFARDGKTKSVEYERVMERKQVQMLE